MEHKIIIAIDGYSSCGKSTLARDLARQLHYRYIDTGAMYRAVTYYLYKNNIETSEHDKVAAALKDIHLDFEYDKKTGRQSIILNGENIEKYIREPEISNRVSRVSEIKEVRQFLVAQQQKMGGRKGIVMDGRDIGTVVFPDAELKLFMTANEETRIMRRYEELKQMGTEASLDEVRENIRMRDHIDTTRKESPLRKAEDAIELDNSEITQEEQLDIVFDLVLKKITKKEPV